MSHNVTLRILFMVRLILRWSAALNQITFISCDKAHVKLASLGWTEFSRYSVDSPSVPAWKPISKGPFTRTLRCELLATVAAPVESKPVFFTIWATIRIEAIAVWHEFCSPNGAQYGVESRGAILVERTKSVKTARWRIVCAMSCRAICHA